MIIVYVDETLIGVVPTDDDDVALDWLQSQCDLSIGGECSYNENDGIYTIGKYKVELMYSDSGYRLDIN